MLYRDGISRPSPHEINQMDRMRKTVQETADFLERCPKPDTFIGRKTQEPFPQETAIPKR